MHLVYLKLSDDTTIPILGVQDAAIAKKKLDGVNLYSS
jgi:hypothetical protein